MFTNIYKDALIKAQRIKQECGFGKKTGKATIKEINWQQEMPLKNDPIVVQTDGTFPAVLKKVQKKKNENGDKSRENRNKQINKLTSKLEVLMLTMNMISDTFTNQP